MENTKYFREVVSTSKPQLPPWFCTLTHNTSRKAINGHNHFSLNSLQMMITSEFYLLKREVRAMGWKEGVLFPQPERWAHAAAGPLPPPPHLHPGQGTSWQQLLCVFAGKWAGESEVHMGNMKSWNWGAQKSSQIPSSRGKSGCVSMRGWKGTQVIKEGKCVEKGTE